MTWRIYYGDGSSIDSGQPGRPRARDVQAIAQEDSRAGWHLQTGADYYILRGGRWIGVDIFGLFDYLLDSGLVLFGRTIGNEEYQAIYERAKAELGPKSSWHSWERRP